jgi:hypothetical protein
MTGLSVLGIFMILYGVFCVVVGIFKIPVIWNMGKIQGFRKFLGEIGTQIFLVVWGGASLGFGIFFLIRNMPK